MKHLFKSEKKWTLKIQKSKIVILGVKQPSISAVFHLARFPGDQKTALTGESLYFSIGAYVNAVDSTGDTSLLWAARSGHLDIVKMLIEFEATIDATNYQGDLS